MDDDLRRRMASVADELRARAEHLNTVLESARAAQYHAVSPDEEIRVTADGRPRVDSVGISARAIRDHGAEGLGPALTEVINAGLAKARTGTWNALQRDIGLPSLDGRDR
ncbi:MAG TPA: hypothetical protein VGD72_12645 [Mycobacteriales bacterium]|jgi:hypothetical protein